MGENSIMETIEIPVLNNIIKDISPRKIPETSLQDGMNILFEDGYLKDRYGTYSLIFEFTDPIKRIGLYRRMFTDIAYMIVCTTKDIYAYDETNGTFKLITRNYNTGTASSSGAAITISGGTLLNSEWVKQNLYQISFDSEDIDSCSTWHTVATITSGTELTLADALTTDVTDSEYCLRLCYDGDEDDSWSLVYPYDEDIDENVMLATNGKDFVQRWAGTGQCVDLDSYTNFCKHLGYWGSTTGDHVIASGIYDTVTGYWNKNAIEVWDAGKLTMLDGATYALHDSISEIVGVLPLGADSLVIYKPNSISIGALTYAGDPSNPIRIQENYKRNLGVPCIEVVAVLESFHIFFNGRNIYMFDGIQERMVGEGNASYIMMNINKNYAHRSFCILIAEKSLYLLFVPWGDSENPNLCIVFNYKDNTFSYWMFKDDEGEELQMTSKGLFRKSYTPTWGSFIDYQTGDLTSGSAVISNVSDTSFCEIGHGIVGTGIQDVSTIINFDADSITMDKTATATGTGVNIRFGPYAKDINLRWQDLKAVENFQRFAIGTKGGRMYELSDEFYRDNDVPIESTFVTKDLELNKGLTFFFHEVTIRAGLRYVDEWIDSPIYVRASMNYGRSWSGWKELILEAAENPQDFKEKKGYFHMKGKALRLEFKMDNPTNFESVFIKYNIGGQSMKYNR
jgi:hypothetical protein